MAEIEPGGIGGSGPASYAFLGVNAYDFTSGDPIDFTGGTVDVSHAGTDIVVAGSTVSLAPGVYSLSARFKGFHSVTSPILGAFNIGFGTSPYDTVPSSLRFPIQPGDQFSSASTTFVVQTQQSGNFALSLDGAGDVSSVILGLILCKIASV